jgi:hypothetical protein
MDSKNILITSDRVRITDLATILLFYNKDHKNLTANEIVAAVFSNLANQIRGYQKRMDLPLCKDNEVEKAEMIVSNITPELISKIGATIMKGKLTTQSDRRIQKNSRKDTIYQEAWEEEYAALTEED